MQPATKLQSLRRRGSSRERGGGKGRERYRRSSLANMQKRCSPASAPIQSVPAAPHSTVPQSNGVTAHSTSEVEEESRCTTLTITAHEEPREVFLGVGDKVEWVNNLQEHLRVTTFQGSKDFFILELPSGGAVQHTFAMEGVFGYYLDPYEYMKGKVVVQKRGDGKGKAERGSVQEVARPTDMRQRLQHRQREWQKQHRQQQEREDEGAQNAKALELHEERMSLEADRRLQKTQAHAALKMQPEKQHGRVDVPPAAVESVPVRGCGAEQKAKAKQMKVPTHELKGEEDTTVNIMDYKFVPDTLVVTAPARVTWVLKEERGCPEHEIVGCSEEPELHFKSCLLEPAGERSWSVVLNQPGVVEYHCSVTNDMKGTIMVQKKEEDQAPSLPPSPTTKGAGSSVIEATYTRIIAEKEAAERTQLQQRTQFALMTPPLQMTLKPAGSLAPAALTQQAREQTMEQASRKPKPQMKSSSLQSRSQQRQEEVITDRKSKPGPLSSSAGSQSPELKPTSADAPVARKKRRRRKKKSAPSEDGQAGQPESEPPPQEPVEIKLGHKGFCQRRLSMPRGASVKFILDPQDCSHSHTHRIVASKHLFAPVELNSRSLEVLVAVSVDAKPGEYKVRDQHTHKIILVEVTLQSREKECQLVRAQGKQEQIRAQLEREEAEKAAARQRSQLKKKKRAAHLIQESTIAPSPQSTSEDTCSSDSLSNASDSLSDADTPLHLPAPVPTLVSQASQALPPELHMPPSAVAVAGDGDGDELPSAVQQVPDDHNKWIVLDAPVEDHVRAGFRGRHCYGRVDMTSGNVEPVRLPLSFVEEMGTLVEVFLPQGERFIITCDEAAEECRGLSSSHQVVFFMPGEYSLVCQGRVFAVAEVGQPWGEEEEQEEETAKEAAAKEAAAKESAAMEATAREAAAREAAVLCITFGSFGCSEDEGEEDGNKGEEEEDMNELEKEEKKEYPAPSSFELEHELFLRQRWQAFFAEIPAGLDQLPSGKLVPIKKL